MQSISLICEQNQFRLMDQAWGLEYPIEICLILFPRAPDVEITKGIIDQSQHY